MTPVNPRDVMMMTTMLERGDYKHKYGAGMHIYVSSVLMVVVFYIFQCYAINPDTETDARPSVDVSA